MKGAVVQGDGGTRLSPHQKMRKRADVLAFNIGNADTDREPVGEREVGVEKKGVEVGMSPVLRPSVAEGVKPLNVVLIQQGNRALALWRYPGLRE